MYIVIYVYVPFYSTSSASSAGVWNLPNETRPLPLDMRMPLRLICHVALRPRIVNTSVVAKWVAKDGNLDCSFLVGAPPL